MEVKKEIKLTLENQSRGGGHQEGSTRRKVDATKKKRRKLYMKKKKRPIPGPKKNRGETIAREILATGG